MKKTNKFNLKIKDYDLKKPDKKKIYSKTLFTEVSKQYDRATKFLSFGRDKAWKKILIKNLPPADNPKTLDLACGTGDITFALKEKYKNSDITGLDLNEDMVQKARQKDEKLKFIISDMNKTGFEENTFDIITGGYALRNAPELKAALKEIHRILKPAGTASFLDFSKPKNKIGQIIEHFFLKLWGNIWGIILHGNPEVYGYIADSLKVFPDRIELEKYLTETGFKNIRTKILFFGFTSIVSFSK